MKEYRLIITHQVHQNNYTYKFYVVQTKGLFLWKTVYTTNYKDIAERWLKELIRRNSK